MTCAPGSVLTDDIHDSVQLVPLVLDDAELLEVNVHKRAFAQYLLHVILEFDQLADLKLVIAQFNYRPFRLQ